MGYEEEVEEEEEEEDKDFSKPSETGRFPTKDELVRDAKALINATVSGRSEEEKDELARMIILLTLKPKSGGFGMPRKDVAKALGFTYGTLNNYIGEHRRKPGYKPPTKKEFMKYGPIPTEEDTTNISDTEVLGTIARGMERQISQKFGKHMKGLFNCVFEGGLEMISLFPAEVVGSDWDGKATVRLIYTEYSKSVNMIPLYEEGMKNMLEWNNELKRRFDRLYKFSHDQASTIKMLKFRLLQATRSHQALQNQFEGVSRVLRNGGLGHLIEEVKESAT